jgi:putative endonuclease
VLYTGITNDLIRRCFEHEKKLIEGFTSKYNVNQLVYFEIFDYIDVAISREKQIKAYSRAKKETLIFKFNSQWSNLYKNGLILNPSKGNNETKYPTL